MSDDDFARRAVRAFVFELPKTGLDQTNVSDGVGQGTRATRGPHRIDRGKEETEGFGPLPKRGI